jgi:hypothetical protein
MPEQLARTASRSLPGQTTIADRASSAEYSSARADGAGALVLLRHIDVPLVVLAASLAIALGAPAFGCAIAAAAWVLQRVLAYTDRRWIARRREPGSRLGLDIAESFGRIWLLAGAIVIAGAIGSRSDGLAAALTVFAAYSVAFAVRLSRGRKGFER